MRRSLFLLLFSTIITPNRETCHRNCDQMLQMRINHDTLRVIVNNTWLLASIAISHTEGTFHLLILCITLAVNYI